MKCISQSEIAVIEETIKDYELTPREVQRVFELVEQRAMDTSLPFNAYSAAHTAASKVIKERK